MRFDAAIFVDDGGIDAFEFESNLIRFDSRDAADRDRAWTEANRLWQHRLTREQGKETSFPLRPPVLLSERRSA